MWGRVLRPLWFNARHVFWVADIVDDAPGWMSIYLAGRRMDWVRAEVGQHVRCRFLDDRFFWQSHPFSIAEAPNGWWLRLRVRMVGRYTRGLQRLESGVGVLLSEPSGDFTAATRNGCRALVIAAGAEIMLVTSLLEELPEGTVLLCQAASDHELAFGEELERVARDRKATIVLASGQEASPWPRRAFSPTGIRELVPDLVDRDVYVCGPQRMIKQSVAALRWLGVTHRRIRCESFEG
jgi:ferredoxin-NADP reductase